jgi:general secretion pathway protein C
MELVLQRYQWVPSVVAAVLGAYLAARTVNSLAAAAIAPKPGLVQQAGGAARPQPLAQHVDLDAEAMARLFEVPLPKPQAADVPVEPQRPSWNPVPTKTGLRGSLIGTSVADPPEYSLCEIINPDTNEPAVYTIGANYLGARIYAIEKDRVLFVNNGINEYMDNGTGAPMVNLGVQPLPQPPANDGSVKQLSENQYVVAKSEINNALTNLSQLATQARIVPSFKNGVANGFKLFSIVPDSLYSKIGMQNGDVIHRINGYEMNSPDKALEIYQKLRDANRIEIELERRGETVHKSYSIE